MVDDRVISIASSKIERAANGVKGKFPHITASGRWITTSDGDWSGGYWVGTLWLAYLMNKHEKYLDLALKCASSLEPRKMDKTFDLGHLFYPSFVLGYKITGDEWLREVALNAAGALVTLFHRKAGFIYNEIYAGGEKFGRTIIDVMMNLPLLWWAHEETSDEEYYNVAYEHSRNTAENFVRADGSTIHVLEFDLTTGNLIRKTTIQGHSVDSCWSRGQAWGIHGFSLAYEATREEKFLKTAEKLAGYFIKNLPNDNVPYWDFNDPRIPDAPKDGSAAAIACSGLITLSKLSGKRRFGIVANRIFRSLSTNYMTEEDRDGILKHGCFHVPKKIGVDEGSIWGDYYFMEALMKSSGILKMVE